MINLIIKTDKETGKVLKQLENINDKEIINYINKLVDNKDGALFIEFEEYE